MAEPDWDTLFPAVGGSSAPARSAPAFPGVILGQPKPIDQFKVRDQELQEEGNRRAAASAAREEKTYNATHNPDGTPKPNADGAKPTEYQAKSAGFLGRMLEAEGMFSAVPGESRDARTAVGQAFHDYAPNVENSFNTGDRQNADQAARNFIAASLRLESGAAIGPEEYRNQYRIFFPMPGDGPGVIKQKAEARRQTIEGFKISAGPLADQAIATVGGAAPDGKALGVAAGNLIDPTAIPPSGPGPSTPPTDGESLRDANGNLIGPGFEGVAYDTNGSPVNVENVVGRKAPDAAPEPHVDGNSSIGMQLAAGLGDVVEGGFNNTAGLIVNPIGRTIYEMSGYGGREYNGGQILRNTFGLPEGDPRISPYTEAASGGLAMSGAARAAAAYAPGAIGSALSTMGATPARDALAATSSVAAGQGAAALGAGPLVQTIAQVAGGAAGYAAPGALRNVKLPAGGRGPPPDLNRAVIEAGERQNVPVRLPDASPSSRNRMAVAEAAPYSGPMVKRAMASDREVMAERVRGQGGGGTPMTQDYTLGQRTQGVGTRYIDRTRNQKNVKYADAEQKAAGQRITPGGAIAEVDRNIAQLEASGANNNAATISYLKGLKEDLSKPDGFSITEFQGLRSGARKKIKGDQALTVTDADRRLDEVVKAFNADAKEQLPEQASDALQNADYFYAQRQDFIKKVLQPFMGTTGKPMTPEQAGKAIRGMTAGRANHDNLKRFLAEANPTEVADFRATIAESLVTGPKGEVGASQLATNIDKVPDNIRALVFGKDGAAALKDIHLLATEKGNTTSGLNNSKSGVVGAAGKIGLRGLLTGAFGFSAGGPMGAVALPAATEVATALGQARTARLLLNPDFTRWLRQTPNTTKASAIDAHFNRLGEIAARSPVIADDARALQQTLLEAFKVSPAPRAAASQEEQDDRRVPPRQR